MPAPRRSEHQDRGYRDQPASSAALFVHRLTHGSYAGSQRPGVVMDCARRKLWHRSPMEGASSCPDHLARTSGASRGGASSKCWVAVRSMLLITRPQLRQLRKERKQDSVERRRRLKIGKVADPG